MKTKKKALETQIRLEVTEALSGIKDAYRRVLGTERALDLAEENFRITSDRFAEGSLTSTDYVDAETALSKTKSETVIARTGLAQAWISYFLATSADITKEVL